MVIVSITISLLVALNLLDVNVFLLKILRENLVLLDLSLNFWQLGMVMHNIVISVASGVHDAGQVWEHEICW